MPPWARRLSGFDAMILGLETPTTHQHTLKIAVVAGTDDHPFDIGHLRHRMERRLHLLAPLRYVLAEVSGFLRERPEVSAFARASIMRPGPEGPSDRRSFSPVCRGTGSAHCGR